MQTLLAYIDWTVRPEIFTAGPISPRWYGLLFAAGFLIGLFMVQKMFRAEKAPEAWLDKAFIYIVVGAVLGARLGHVFFYDWPYYSQHPGEILQIWKGGLASHGGAIGIIIALWFFSRFVSKKPILWMLDKVVVPTALAGCFIRLGNLMNSEIVGKVTNASWAFRFPRATQPEEKALWTDCESCTPPEGESECIETGQSLLQRVGSRVEEIAQCIPNMEDVPARHPVQLYESLSYLAIFAILYFVYWKTGFRNKLGFLFGLFLVLIFGVRILMEQFKVSQGGFETSLGNVLTTGQWLSIPFVLIGLYFVFRPVKRTNR